MQKETQLTSNNVNRRAFISLLWRGLLALNGLLGLGVLWRFFEHQSDSPSPTEFDLGPAEDYPLGSQTPFPQARAVILHTSGGYSALSTTCPHLGCQVEPSEDGFTCPCHGSRFDQKGVNLNGPATKPLPVLRVEPSTNGNLVLYTAGSKND